MIRWTLLLAACTAPTPPTETVAARDHDTAVAPRPSLPRLASATSPHTLVAEPATLDIGGDAVQGYTYDVQRFDHTVGDTLDVTLDNRLDAPTTNHWHGAGAPYEMDGVPWQRAPTAPGDTFRYTFPLEQSGTFWFHPHFDTARQVDLGLYGMLVVHDPDAPAVDDDVALVFDSWGESEDDPHHHAPEGSDLQWTVNGAVDPVASVPAGWVRLRLLNASNTGYLDLDTTEMTVLALDQGVRTAPWTASSVLLGPGDRAELLVELDGPLDLRSRPFSLQGGRTWGDDRRLLTLEPGAPGTVSPPVWDEPAREPSDDPGRTDVSYTLQGDSQTGRWRINHEAFPEVTIEELPLGSDVILEVKNLSPTHHPFHGHGHAFEVLSLDGVPPDRLRIEDTFDLPVYSTARLRFTADRPGDWMQHCHILPHADGGMMTVLRVTDAL
jgi:FtsP/CotA-like multicopper oxidase with cupredoxin domain